MADINTRMQQIEVERSYRIAGMLEQTAETIETQVVSKLTDMLDQWKKSVFLFDGILFTLLFIACGVILTMTESWGILQPFAENVIAQDTQSLVILGIMVSIIGYIHFSIRGAVAKSLVKKLPAEFGHDHNSCKQYTQAFLKCTSAFRPMFLSKPSGWNSSNQQILAEVKDEANDYIQSLNDLFTDPSGRKADAEAVNEPVIDEQHNQSAQQASQ